METGAAWPMVEDPVVAMRESGDVAREKPELRFKSNEELLAMARTRLQRREVMALLTEGYFRRLLNSGGERRLMELLREEDARRQRGEGGVH